MVIRQLAALELVGGTQFAKTTLEDVGQPTTCTTTCTASIQLSRLVHGLVSRAALRHQSMACWLSRLCGLHPRGPPQQPGPYRENFHEKSLHLPTFICFYDSLYEAGCCTWSCNEQPLQSSNRRGCRWRSSSGFQVGTLPGLFSGPWTNTDRWRLRATYAGAEQRRVKLYICSCSAGVHSEHL